MADVWIAEDQRLGRQVAVKILHDQYAASEAFVERFRREAQAAANLSHANIVAVHDWGQDGDTYFMVMELVQGRNLRDVLRSEGALLPRRVAEIGAEVCVALSVAHNQGLVHRDIKPANVLLTPDGSVKVADFGIARAWDDSENLTKTGAVIGTATYFSPEQAQGQMADSRSDLYSVGVVMYELLAGQPPFAGESPVAVAYQHVQETPPALSELNPNVPPGLEAIIAKAMAKSPADRYQSAAEMVEDIDRLLAGQVPLASPQNNAPTRLMGAGTPPPASRDQAVAAYETGQPTRYDPVSQEQPLFREPGSADRTTLAIGVVAALALLALGIIMLVRLIGSTEGPDLLTLPELTGNQPASAIEELSRLGVSIEQQVVASTEIARGLVVGTDPPAGTQVERGTLVKLLVSGGDATIEVPRLIDLTEDQARTAIEVAQLEVGDFVFESSPVVEAGVVMSQDPEAGTLVAAGTEVDLVVSAGTNAFTVPDVVGRSENDALFVLSETGFSPDQIRIERRPSAEVLEGFVIETTPEAEQFVPQDGFVTVVISEGAVPSVVPSVIGDDGDVAQEELEDQGFVVVFDDPKELPFDDELNGVVAEQDPEAGQTAEFGSTVRLRIGEAATEAPVPNVLNNDEATARATIEAEGFVFAKGPDIALGAGDPADGTAMEQAPPPNEVRPIGSTVEVRFGKAAATTTTSSTTTAPTTTTTTTMPVTLQSGTVLGETVDSVETTYDTLTWTDTGTLCHEPGADGTTIGASDPEEGETVDDPWVVDYWLAQDDDTLPDTCTDLP